MNQFLINIFVLIIGYLLGSLSPSYVFGKFKKIDIREVGSRNAGTMNVWHSMGILPAVPTAVFDLGKGVLALLISREIGADFIFSQISGRCAVAGHIFPFYLRFRGGQGVACAVGLMFYYFSRYLLIDFRLLFVFGFLAIIVLIFTYITKRGGIVGNIVLPLLGYSVFYLYPHNPYNIYFTLIILHIIFIGIYNISEQKQIQIQDQSFRTHWWRVALRPVAVVFVIFYHFHSQTATVILIGSVALFFIILDLIRFFTGMGRKLMTEKIQFFFKNTERKKISSMTMFLISSCIITLVFEKEIALASLTFLIFGDIFSKIFGLGFGRHKIFDKTVEGSLAYLGGALICGYILYTVLGIPPLLLLTGAIAAAVAEALPLGLDDNFTVGLISGAVMTSVQLFG
ncbi:MAG: glycerol-3-phosphate acyltransferase [bacterium]